MIFDIFLNYSTIANFVISGFCFWLIFVLLRYLLRSLYCFYHLPPGPWGLPVVGCLLRFRGSSPHLWYAEMAKRYGKIMSIKLGRNRVVCIGSAEIARKLLKRPDSTARPDTPLNNLLQGFGIFLSVGDLWKRQRHFLHEKLRALGAKTLNNDRMEHIINVEINELIVELANLNSAPVNPVMMFGRHIHNIICQLMMSFRFKELNDDFLKFNGSVTESMDIFGFIHFAEHLPFIVKLLRKKAVLYKIKDNLKEVYEFHAEHLKLRRKIRESGVAKGKESKDLLDFYLDRIDDERNNEDLGGDNSIFVGVSEDKQIVQIMNDLFSAGMETSRTTLVWALLMMVREKEVAKRVRHVLANHVGIGQRVGLEHRSELAYVEAVMLEVIRISSVVPLGAAHVNEKDWTEFGYFIPAGSHIVTLINVINMDPIEFPEPEKFKPERFLKNGKLHVPISFIPFGVGRRICMGEQLAKMELFLFFANIMNQFEFDIPEGQKVPGLIGAVGVTHTPKPFTLSFNKITA